jgi:hypothetical protein
MNIEIVKIVLSIIVSIAIVTSAWIFKGTEYENAWFYITCVWIVILPLIDFFIKKKNDKEQ